MLSVDLVESIFAKEPGHSAYTSNIALVNDPGDNTYKPRNYNMPTGELITKKQYGYQDSFDQMPWENVHSDKICAFQIFLSMVSSTSIRTRNPPDPDRPQQTPLFKSRTNKKRKKNFFHVHSLSINLLVVDNSGVKTLGLLDVDGLDVRVELLLGALLVVTLTRDADAETEGNTLDTALPDLLVELGVKTDVLGAL